MINRYLRWRKRRAFLRVKQIKCPEIDKAELERLGLQLMDLFCLIDSLRINTFWEQAFGSYIGIAAFEVADVIDTIDLLVSDTTEYGRIDELYNKVSNEGQEKEFIE